MKTMKKIMLSLLLVTFISTFNHNVVNAEEPAQISWYDLFTTNFTNERVAVKFRYIDIIGTYPYYVTVSSGDYSQRVNASSGYDWTADNNGTYHIAWYDNNDSILYENDLTINTIDRLSPNVSYTEQTEIGTTSTITFVAEDTINETYPYKSSPNAEDFWWSEDSFNWTQTGEYKVEYTSNYALNNKSVYCKDKAGNITHFSNFAVTKVDKWAPTQIDAKLVFPENSKQAVGVDRITYTNSEYVDIVITAKDVSREIQTGTGEVDSDITSSGFSSVKLITTDNAKVISSNTIRITENGSYEYTLLDTVGNESIKYTYTVNCFDREPPTVKISKNVGSEYVTISVSCSDDKVGLPTEYMLKDNETTWQKNSSSNYTKNGKHTYKFKDALDNIVEANFEITECDEIPPTVTHTEGDWGATSKITIIAKDDKLLNTNYISWDNGKTWTSSNTHNYDKNGKYIVVVRDAYQNQTSYEFKVTKVDNKKPTVSLSYSNELTSDNVSVKASCKDDESGLHEQYILFNNGSWSNNSTFTVSKNGTYEFKVRDKAGNIMTKSVTINCIDKENPSIIAVKKTPDNSSNTKKVTVAIQAKDYGVAGLASKYISWDGGRTWTNQPTNSYTANGAYTVKVQDSVGHIASTIIQISEIKAASSSSGTGTNTSTNTNTNKNGKTNITVVKSDTNKINYNDPQNAGKSDETLYVQTKSGLVEIKKSNVDKLIKKYDTVPLYVARYEDKAILATADGVYDLETEEEVSEVDTESVDIVEDDFVEPTLGFTNDPNRQKSTMDTSKVKKLIIPIVASCLATILIVVVLILVWTKPKNDQ